jgi:hypothetical protein
MSNHKNSGVLLGLLLAATIADVGSKRFHSGGPVGAGPKPVERKPWKRTIVHPDTDLEALVIRFTYGQGHAGLRVMLLSDTGRHQTVDILYVSEGVRDFDFDRFDASRVGDVAHMLLMGKVSRPPHWG